MSIITSSKLFVHGCSNLAALGLHVVGDTFLSKSIQSGQQLINHRVPVNVKHLASIHKDCMIVMWQESPRSTGLGAFGVLYTRVKVFGVH